MKKFKALKVMKFLSGKIGLDDNQAKRRRKLIEKVGDGVYEIIKPITVKAGEVVKLVAVSKANESSLECLEKGHLSYKELRAKKDRTVKKRISTKKAVK